MEKVHFQKKKRVAYASFVRSLKMLRATHTLVQHKRRKRVVICKESTYKLSLCYVTQQVSPLFLFYTNNVSSLSRRLLCNNGVLIYPLTFFLDPLDSVSVIFICSFN